MDDLDRYLKLLREQFPDQLVLYLDDVAKVLGGSKRAIEGMLQRKTLPFATRKVGGRVVVDLVQVARYLAGVDEEEELSRPAQTLPPGKRTTRVKDSDAVESAKPAKDDRYNVRKALADWRRVRAYNCYCLLKEPEKLEPQEGLIELFELLLFELVRVDLPSSGAADHVALWTFKGREEAMEPTLVTFKVKGPLAEPDRLSLHLREQLNHHGLALVQAMRRGRSVAEGFYLRGRKVSGLSPKELVATWLESAPA